MTPETPVERRLREMALLDELWLLVGMQLSHFIVEPHQNTRGERIECVEYWPITEWIAAKRALLARCQDGAL